MNVAKFLVGLSLFFTLTLLAQTKVTGPSETFTAGAGFAKTVTSAQGTNGLFGDLENTYYSVLSLKLLKKEVPQKTAVCDAVSKASTATVADAYYAASVATALQCSGLKAEAVQNTLSPKLKASSTLRDLYFAVSGLHQLKLLGGQDLNSVARRVLDLKEEDGSFRTNADASEGTNLDAGFALLVLSQVYPQLSAELKTEVDQVAYEIDNLFARATTKGNSLSFVDDNSDPHVNLEATSRVFEGVNTFAGVSTKKVELSQEQVAKLTEFFVSNQNVQSLRDIYFVLNGVETATTNRFFFPLVATVVSDTLVARSSDSSSIRVKVTDLYGNFATGAKLYISSISPFSSPKAPIVKGQDLYPEDKNEKTNTVYSFNFLANKPEPGLYSVSFTVVPSNKKFISSTEDRVVKVVTAVSIQDCVVQTFESLEGTETHFGDANKYSCDNGKAIDEVVSNVYTPYVRVSYRVRNQASGKPLQVHQSFLRLYQKDGENEHVYVAKLGEKNLYTATLNLTSKSLARHRLASGAYKLDLIIGDSFIQSSSSQNVAAVQIVSPDVQASVDPLKPRPDISHVFRAPEKRPPESFSLVFTGVVLSPVLVLLVGLGKVGFNLYNFPLGFTFFYAVAFHVTLGLIVLLFGLFWLKLNMFETLGYLSVLLVAAVFTGHKTLQYLHTYAK